jgi:hypothetical protein
MKLKLMMLLLAAVIGSAATAQKNKKKANPAAAATAEDKGWKPTKGDTRNPFDTTKTKVTKNNLGGGEDPFGKKGKAGAKGKTMAVKQKTANGMEAEDTDEYKANGSPKKMKKAGKTNVAPDKLVEGDDPFGKPTNGLGDGEDPFDKSPRGKNRKKAAGQDGYISDSVKTKKGKQAKAAGYANQEVSYMQPAATSPQPGQTNEAASGTNTNTSGINIPATPNNVGQASTVDKSPNYIFVRYELETIEASKKEITKGLNETKNEIGWYNKFRVNSQGISNLKIFSVTLYKTDGTTTLIPINETINAGLNTSFFKTGLLNQTKNGILMIEKINKVSVSYELLDPGAKKKATAIHVYLYKSE